MQIVRNTPKSIKMIPWWVRQFLSKEICKTGVLTPMDAEAINFKMLPWVSGFLIILISMVIFGLITGITIAIMIPMGVCIGIITISFFVSFIKGGETIHVPQGWVGVFTVFGTRIGLIGTEGDFTFRIPKNILGKEVFGCLLVPIRQMTRDLTLEKISTQEGGEVEAEVTYTIRILDYVAASIYMIPQTNHTSADAIAACQGIKDMVDDYVYSAFTIAVGRQNYQDRLTKDGEDMDEISRSFWKDLTKNRARDHVRKVKDSDLDGRDCIPLDMHDRPKSSRIRLDKGDVIATRGGRLLLGTKKDETFWKICFDSFGEHLWDNETGALIQEVWIRKIKAKDDDFHKSFTLKVIDAGKGEALTALIDKIRGPKENGKYISEITEQEARDRAYVILGKRTINEEIKSFGFPKDTIQSILELARMYKNMK
jgi:hypothetical protein